MKVSRKTDYAVRALAYIAFIHIDKGVEERIFVSEVADKVDVPKSFLAKIMQDLARLGIIHSHRGTNGGFSLARQPSEITLGDIFRAMEGTLAVRDCMVDPEFCMFVNICGMKGVWEEAQESFLSVLDRTTLEKLVTSRTGIWKKETA